MQDFLTCETVSENNTGISGSIGFEAVIGSAGQLVRFSVYKYTGPHGKLAGSIFQYSSANMIVSARSVFAGSLGSSELRSGSSVE